MKYAPDQIHQETADILNLMAETGQTPNVLTEGILIPLPKPKKKNQPKINLRPIILLSTLRKITAICLMDRIWDRLKEHIPKSQAAYQPGRSTTEEVFAIKTLAEKAVISSEYKIYLLMVDMSKAFDTVDRNSLFTQLKEILNQDELHLLYTMINNVKIKVRVNKTESNFFLTNIGVCLGDCLSAILFIFYLAKSSSSSSSSSYILD